MQTCLDCPKRSECTEPCEWLEAELKKVTYYQRETQHIRIPDDNDPHDDDKVIRKVIEQDEGFYRDVISGIRHKKLVEMIYYLHNQNKSPTEISYHLPCSRQYINQVVILIVQLKESYKRKESLLNNVYKMLKVQE